jgi:protease-4
MKDFIKFMFASFLGTLITLLLLSLFFFGLIAGIVAMAESEEVKIEPNTVLHIKWTTPIKDRSSDNPFEGFNFGDMSSNKPVGLNDILKNIEKATHDPNIDGIFLDMESIPARGTTLEEIRNKLMEFQESGKFILSYGNSYDQGAYYLASLSDNLYMNPEGMILFKGLHAQIMFLKGMLDKIDVDVQIVRGPDNKYKSAVEPLMLEKMSEANREQITTLLNSIWGKVLLAISQSRGIGIEELNSIADNLDITTSEKALEHNFVDAAMFRDEIYDKLKELTDTEKDDDLEMVSFGSYTNVKSTIKPPSTKDRVAVVFAQGDIIQGKGNPNSIGAETMAKAIRKARKSEKVKAIVFRVNSPGGDALASDIIRREVELASKEKPFIVSMGDVAASGGYWISTNADYIFAQPTTITGSIGVFGVIPNFQGLFNNKLGITFDDVVTNQNADFIDVMKPMNEFQHKKLDEMIIKIYDDFVNLVATTRDLDPGFVDGIARGRVWSGVDARELGLVDELGGLEDAIAYAVEQADLGEKYKIREYPIRKPFIEQLMEELTGQARARIIGDELKEFKTYYDQIETIKRMEGVQARLPFFYSIN